MDLILVKENGENVIFELQGNVAATFSVQLLENIYNRGVDYEKIVKRDGARLAGNFRTKPKVGQHSRLGMLAVN